MAKDKLNIKKHYRSLFFIQKITNDIFVALPQVLSRYVVFSLYRL